MAERSRPLKGTGGKVMGTRWMIEKMCCSPSSFQKAWLFWSSRMCGFPSGMMYFPMLRTLLALPMSVDESIGM